MKTMLQAISATAFLLSTTLLGAPLTASTAYAQAVTETVPMIATVDADPALWVVKDKDTTIYLFGTVHILKPGLSWFDEAVKTAFDKSGEVVLEIVEPEPAAMQAMVMKVAVAKDGKALSTRLAEPDRGEYIKAMESIGVPYQAFETLKPWMAGITLAVMPLSKLGYDPESGAEKAITVAAKSAGKTLGQLETPEQQLGYFDGLPEAEQIKFLNATVDAMDELAPTMENMVDAWAKGDPVRLAGIMNESMDDSPELYKLLLEDRNARWATWIDTRLDTPGTVFIAVGAGHLAGKGSVQEKLDALKIKSERVRY